ncbi:MAG: S9 family peptidase, partial [Thermomicrobiales bacterium]
EDKKKGEAAAATEKPRNQVWTIRIDGGEATQVTNHPNGAGSPSWSPDGAHLVFVASDDVKPSDDFLPPTTNGQVADERIIHDLRNRFDARGWLEKYAHLWTVDLATGEHAQRTFGDVNDSSPAWSPNGETIAFIGNRRDDRKRLDASTILTIPAVGGEVTILAPDDASFDHPVWSPSGERLAFFGHLDASVGGKNSTLWTVGADGSDVTNHTAGWDDTFGDVGLSDVVGDSGEIATWVDEQSILALASHHGEGQIHRIDLQTNEVTPVTAGKRRVTGFAKAGDYLVYSSGQIHQPFELFRASITGENETKITSVNDQVVNDVELPAAIDLEITAPDGKPIQAWLIPPVGFEDNTEARHPLILEIHGGPHAMYGYAMFHEMQLMASRGYAVLFCNPRGSSGYGEEFTGITRGRWGESDMPDVIAAVEKALELPWIDPNRVGITGGSYGGYLTNWVIGHDDRFKAAVTQRCVSNFYSFFGTSDIGFDFGVLEFGGLPWSDAEKLLKYSPISYVDKITAPLLIIHSEQDLRCPIEQSEQMFTALKYLEREVAFVRIPGESHGLSRNGTPSRRLARLHHLIGWFDQHL